MMSIVEILTPEEVFKYTDGFNQAFTDTHEDKVTVNTDPVWCAGYEQGLRHVFALMGADGRLPTEQPIETVVPEPLQLTLPLDDTVLDPRD